MGERDGRKEKGGRRKEGMEMEVIIIGPTLRDFVFRRENGGLETSLEGKRTLEKGTRALAY